MEDQIEERDMIVSDLEAKQGMRNLSRIFQMSMYMVFVLTVCCVMFIVFVSSPPRLPMLQDIGGI